MLSETLIASLTPERIQAFLDESDFEGKAFFESLSKTLLP